MNARRTAYELLTAVDEQDAYANLAMPKLLDRSALSSRDAAFATELGYGTLRWQGFYDLVIDELSSRPAAQLDAPVRRTLRLGLHQLLSMRLPPHAAVGETVTLAKQVGVRSASGMVNAILRRAAEHPLSWWQDRVARGRSGVAALAARNAHPEWIAQSFADSLGERADELAALLEADNENPAVNLVSLPGIGPEPTTLGEPNRYSPCGARAAAGNPAQQTAQRGVRVQDEGSQLAALALSRARPAAPGELWLDVCAGPGGKAALLAAEARLAGATLLANELAEHRVGLVRSALRDVDPNVEVRQADGRAIAESPNTFDRILLDAPCSGLGALRRRPEARWRKTEADLRGLSALQSELLNAALVALKPGGILAYVTCSPHLAETTEIVRHALHTGVSGRPVRALDTAELLDQISLRPLNAAVSLDPGSSGTAVQLWPHRHGTDAMFIALLSS